MRNLQQLNPVPNCWVKGNIYWVTFQVGGWMGTSCFSWFLCQVTATEREGDTFLPQITETTKTFLAHITEKFQPNSWNTLVLSVKDNVHNFVAFSQMPSHVPWNEVISFVVKWHHNLVSRWLDKKDFLSTIRSSFLPEPRSPLGRSRDCETKPAPNGVGHPGKIMTAGYVG